MATSVNSGLGAKETESLLSELCVNLGFCLQDEASEHFYRSPPADIEAFTRAVLVSEGMGQKTADRKLFAQVRATVEKAFQKHAERSGPNK